MRDVFDMSRKKLDRAAVLEKLADGRLTSHDDAALLDPEVFHHTPSSKQLSGALNKRHAQIHANTHARKNSLTND